MSLLYWPSMYATTSRYNRVESSFIAVDDIMYITATPIDIDNIMAYHLWYIRHSEYFIWISQPSRYHYYSHSKERVQSPNRMPGFSCNRLSYF